MASKNKLHFRQSEPGIVSYVCCFVIINCIQVHKTATKREQHVPVSLWNDSRQFSGHCLTSVLRSWMWSRQSTFPSPRMCLSPSEGQIVGLIRVWAFTLDLYWHWKRCQSCKLTNSPDVRCRIMLRRHYAQDSRVSNRLFDLRNCFTLFLWKHHKTQWPARMEKLYMLGSSISLWSTHHPRKRKCRLIAERDT